MQKYTLFELNEYIKRVLALNLPDAIWVSAEIIQANHSRGHYFLSLGQKSEEQNEVIAQAEAVIWKNTYLKLKKKIGRELPSIIQDGVAVLLKVKVDYHERFGIKLIVENIDPAYTLGKLELQKQETLKKLEQTGLLYRNKQEYLPIVLQRIAILSSKTAAGYQDFCNQLIQNEYGYVFQLKLFPTAVQGERVQEELLKQLKKIQSRNNRYDCIVVIRGGGSKLDLSAFDDYLINETLANASLPILCGIGHETDETVLDLVAHTALKTPTAVADFILQRNLQFEGEIMELGYQVNHMAQHHIVQLKLQLQQFSQSIPLLINNNLAKRNQSLAYLERQIVQSIKTQLKSNQQQLKKLETIIQLLSLDSAFERGFSITTKNGKVVRSIQELKKGDELVHRFKDGEKQSKVT